MSADPDYYAILQVNPNADPEVVDAAYRRLARKYHPDVNSDPQSAWRMKSLNEAYEVLGNHENRSAYDHRTSSRRAAFNGDEPIGDRYPDSASTTASSGGAAAWLRWIAVLPGALVAVIAVSFPVHWAVLIATSGSNDDGSFGLSSLPPETLERFGIAFFSPFAFVVSGAWVAPAHKVQASIALAVIWALLLGAGLMYVATSGGYANWGWVEFTLVVALGLGGLSSGMFQVYEKHRK